MGRRVSTLPPTSSSASLSQQSLQMRDASASYWFQLGNSVRVVDDVDKAGHNLKDRVGKVVETWEKCDVDPTCCCAEQVDLNMAVRVEFPGTEADKRVEGESFYHYFAEKELEKVQDTTTAAFDGMSCKAFKLDVLNLEQKPRRIASFEPSRPDDDATD
eukprot:scaffold6844_cov173-Amphora_coffeaeformis.AAC.2